MANRYLLYRQVIIPFPADTKYDQIYAPNFPI
jgi:hypothetical protein